MPLEVLCSREEAAPAPESGRHTPPRTQPQVPIQSDSAPRPYYSLGGDPAGEWICVGPIAFAPRMVRGSASHSTLFRRRCVAWEVVLWLALFNAGQSLGGSHFRAISTRPISAFGTGGPSYRRARPGSERVRQVKQVLDAMHTINSPHLALQGSDFLRVIYLAAQHHDAVLRADVDFALRHLRIPE